MRTRTTTAFLLLTCVIVAAYLNALPNGFVYDDDSTIVSNKLVKDWRNLPVLFKRDYFAVAGELSWRPLVTLSYFLDYALWGLSPYGYHLTNLLLHLTGTWLFYVFARATPGGGRWALPAALLFGVHPMLSETVNGVSFREDMLAMAGMLGAMVMYQGMTRGRGENGFNVQSACGGLNVQRSTGAESPISPSPPYPTASPDGTGAKCVAFLGLSLAAQAAAMAAKEVAVLLPVLIVGYDLCFRGREHAARNAKRFVWAYGALSAAFVYVRFFAMKSAAETAAPMGLDERLLMAVKVVGYYVAALLAPRNLRPDYTFSASPTWVDGALALLGLALLCAAALSERSGRRLMAFWVIWFVVTVGPVSGLVRLRNVIAERHTYVPAVGVCGLLVMAARDRRALVALTALCFVSLVGQRGHTWRDDGTLWSDCVRCTPGSPRAHHALGNAYQRRDLSARAAQRQQSALRKDPNYIEAWVNLALAQEALGRLDDAAASCQRALRVDPKLVREPVNFALAHNHLGSIRRQQGRLDEAMAEYEAALKVAPDLAEARYNLGNAYAAKREFDQAAEAYRAALKLSPGHAGARENLGNVLFAGGKLTNAADEYRAALALRPQSASLHNNLGNVYLRMGQIDAAIGEYRAAVQAGDANGMAFFGLGNAYAQKNMRREAVAAFREFLTRWKGEPGYAQAAREKLAKLANGE
ncbi:MAG: tetratricopeptide repeat protein [Planctomycetes bacterium]|nr:tetratricopeptide repeat protein [Planctomycetota bacterium]